MSMHDAQFNYLADFNISPFVISLSYMYIVVMMSGPERKKVPSKQMG